MPPPKPVTPLPLPGFDKLKGVPKALLPATAPNAADGSGSTILGRWWNLVNTRQILEVFLVTNANKFKYYEVSLASGRPGPAAACAPACACALPAALTCEPRHSRTGPQPATRHAPPACVSALGYCQRLPRRKHHQRRHNLRRLAHGVGTSLVVGS